MKAFGKYKELQKRWVECESERAGGEGDEAEITQEIEEGDDVESQGQTRAQEVDEAEVAIHSKSCNPLSQSSSASSR